MNVCNWHEAALGGRAESVDIPTPLTEPHCGIGIPHVEAHSGPSSARARSTCLQAALQPPPIRANQLRLWFPHGLRASVRVAAIRSYWPTNGQWPSSSGRKARSAGIVETILK